MDRHTLLAYLALGLLLIVAIAADFLVSPDFFSAIVYALPLLAAALLLPSRAVAVLAAGVFVLSVVSLFLATEPPGVRLLRLLGIVAVAFFALRLATVREQSLRLARESEESRRRTEEILESITDAFFGLDLDWRFTYINAEAETLLQKRRGQVLGKGVWEQFPEAVGSTSWNEYHRAMSQGVTVAFEDYYPPLGRWFDVRAYPNPSGLSVYFRDITERKRAEREREQLLEEVERRSAELEKLQQQRTKHVLGISHGLRTPLTVIQGQAQLLLRALGQMELDGRLHRGAEAIFASSQQMSLTLRDLVDMTSLESGQPLRLNRVPLDLAAFVADLKVRLSAALATERLILDAQAGLPMVSADPDRLERVMANLLSNALKFSQSDTQVTLRLARHEDEVVVSVTDLGVGVPAERLPHIFDPYQRVESGLERAESMGLGLYLAKGMVEAMGGRIWAESGPGKGSSFSFTLPTATGA